jgi:hypothetical protein
MFDEDETRDPTWQLLGKARKIEPEPFFAQKTRRIAASSAQGRLASIGACLRLNRPRKIEPQGEIRHCFGTRFTVAGIAIAGLAVAATSMMVLRRQVEEVTTFAQGEPETAHVIAATSASDSPENPDDQIDMLPEFTSLEREIDETSELLSFVSTLDVNNLEDHEIQAMLF